jgi:hypothetical protein
MKKLVMGKEKKRYPGLNAYTKEDHLIFKGREADSQKLLAQLILNKTLVLHAESGTGKSSLIQAGLLDNIEKLKETFQPVIIRLNEIVANKNEGLLVNFIRRKIFESIPGLKNKELPL